MNEEKNQDLFINESRDLREKFRRAKQGSSSSQDDPKRDKAQTVLIVIMILYGVILVTFVLLLYWVSDFRYYCFDILNRFNEEGQYLGALYISLVGLWFVLTGFNVVMYDILVGFLIKPYWFALLAVSIAKFIAKYLGFLIGRYLIRNYIYVAMNENLYFITCYLAAERKPVKIMYLIQFVFVPTIFKTYACGLFRITQWQFIHSTIFGTVTWAGFWVYIGANLESLTEILQSGNTDTYIPIWLKYTMITLCLLVIIYFFKLTNAIYQEIQHDASLGELSHIIEKEERKSLIQETLNSKIFQQQNQID